MKRYLELEIKTLQNAPRDADKLRRLLEIMQRQKEEKLMANYNFGLRDLKKEIKEKEEDRRIRYEIF